ncbi:hypothetical protein PspLS_02051 [Pyricularia sp. CBS 133598]|nr:hypothetical protein PspLS_02051 [Pyricularia sp. CBS 133598]
MAPKKKEVQKFSLGEFMTDSAFGGGSWADEVEDTYGTQPLPPSDRRGNSGYGGGGYGSSDRMPYAPRERDSFPQRIPDKPPYTAHLGNLSYDATNETVTDFFAACEVVSVRIVEDREQQRPKGFGYAEFATAEGLQKALNFDGDSFQGRVIRVRIADPPKNSEGRSEARELDWSQPRKGPLADMPRNNDRRGPSEFGERREFNNERREFNDRRGPRELVDDGKVRDFSDWSRKGPLSPRPDTIRQNSSREGSRPPFEGGDSSNREDRRSSPATWGEGRQDGSRPPRREFADRPAPERAPTAAEKDMQWRSSMRPDQPTKSPAQSRSGSEAPPSPAPAAAAPAPGGRPKLNLIKRTISEAPDVTSPALTGGDSKASPFGAARPIDTAAKEREIEEKRLAAVQEKKEAEEKAKEERRLAKEAADKKAEEDAKAAEQNGEEEKAEEAPEAKEAKSEQPAEAATPTEQKLSVRTREQAPVPKSRATESGNWRSASSGERGGRGAPSGPRRGGGGGPRGGRNDGPRPPRANGGQQSQPGTPVTAGPDSTPDEDGWTTVKKAKGSGRPIAS